MRPLTAAISTRSPLREEGFEVLDAKFLQPVGVGHLGHGDAVVEAHLVHVALLAVDADMAEAVELGADLADLGGHEIVVVDHLVVAERAASGCPGDAESEDPRPESGMPAS